MTNKATNSVYKKIETVLWDKKIPEKKPCCTYNKPFSSKLLTLQGNGTHNNASFVMLYHIPDLEPNRRQKICPVAKGLISHYQYHDDERPLNHFIQIPSVAKKRGKQQLIV